MNKLFLPSILLVIIICNATNVSSVKDNNPINNDSINNNIPVNIIPVNINNTIVNNIDDDLNSIRTNDNSEDNMSVFSIRDTIRNNIWIGNNKSEDETNIESIKSDNCNNTKTNDNISEDKTNIDSIKSDNCDNIKADDNKSVNNTFMDSIVNIIGADKIDTFINSEDNIYKLTFDEYDFLYKITYKKSMTYKKLLEQKNNTRYKELLEQKYKVTYEELLKQNEFIPSKKLTFFELKLHKIVFFIDANVSIFYKDIKKFFKIQNHLQTVSKAFNITDNNADIFDEAYLSTENIIKLGIFTMFPIYFKSLLEEKVIASSNISNNIIEKINAQSIDNILDKYKAKCKDYLTNIIESINFQFKYDILNKKIWNSIKELNNIQRQSGIEFNTLLGSTYRIKNCLNNLDDTFILSQYIRILTKHFMECNPMLASLQ